MPLLQVSGETKSAFFESGLLRGGLLDRIWPQNPAKSAKKPSNLLGLLLYIRFVFFGPLKNAEKLLFLGPRIRTPPDPGFLDRDGNSQIRGPDQDLHLGPSF